MPNYADLKKTGKVSKPAKGTLQWLITHQSTNFRDDAERLRTDDFVEWRDSNLSCILLVTAAPGQGKSVLSNFVVDHLEEQKIPERKKVIYYFCNIKNDESSRTATSVVRALIVQLCEDPRLFRKLLNHFQNKDDKKDLLSAPLGDLWVIFSDLIKTDIYSCIYCIIDGLDVYTTEMHSLLGYLVDISFRPRGRPLFKLFCTSRPEKFVMDIGLSPMRILCASKGDLSAFTDARLKSFARRFTDQMKNAIRKGVMSRVDRTFLWISIVLRELRSLQDTSVSSIEEKIEAVPSEITDLYMDLVQKILKRGSVGVAILAWITYAKRPLSLRELEVAIAVGKKKESATTWNDCEKEIFPLNKEWIRENLGTLVDVIDDTPFLIHQTLRDFLRDSSIWKTAEIMSDFKRPELLLADVCMTYLAFRKGAVIPCLNEMVRDDPLLFYAGSFWHRHIQTAGDFRENARLRKLQAMLHGSKLELWMEYQKGYRKVEEEYGPMEIPTSVWEIAIHYDIGWLANLLLKDKPHDLEEHLSDHYCHEAARLSLSVFQEITNHTKIRATKEVVKAALENTANRNEVMVLLLEKVEITNEVVIAIVGLCDNEVMSLLLNRWGNKVVITEEVVVAAEGYTTNGKGKMMLLLENNEVKMTEKGAVTVVRLCNEEVIILLLNKRSNEVEITEEVVKAAAGNIENGKEVMALLLENRGNEVEITEDVVKTAVGNIRSGKEVMMLLLKERGNEVKITEEVVETTAGNKVNGKDIMTVLLEERGNEVKITEGALKAAAENTWNGTEMMALLLEHRGNEVKIIEEVVKAAAENEMSGEEIMTVLLEERGNEAEITEGALKAAAENMWNGTEVMALLLKNRGNEVKITEEVVKAAAENEISGKEIMTVLLEERGNEVKITEGALKAAAGNMWSGTEVMALLLQNRGNEVKITEEVVKAVAGNMRSGEAVMKLLLKGRGNEVKITEGVLKAAAGNRQNGNEVMMLLLKERGNDVKITAEVFVTMASYCDERLMILLLDKCGEGMVTEKVIKAAAGNRSSGKELMKLLLVERGNEVNITEKVVKAAAGNEMDGKELMKLLLNERGNEIKITEGVLKAAAMNRKNGNEVMKLLFKKRSNEVKITDEVIKAAAGNERHRKEIMRLLLKKRREDVSIT